MFILPVLKNHLPWESTKCIGRFIQVCTITVLKRVEHWWCVYFPNYWKNIIVGRINVNVSYISKLTVIYNVMILKYFISLQHSRLLHTQYGSNCSGAEPWIPGGGGGGGGGGGVLEFITRPDSATSKFYIRGGDWKRGSKFYNDPPNARKGGSIFYISMKSLQKKGAKNLQF